MKKLAGLLFMFGTSILLLTASFALQSCEDKGASTLRLTGNENELPQELKGMKVYSIHVGQGSYMKVAVLNNKIIGNSYQSGKVTENSVVVDLSTNNEIQIESILMENDSIIICKKVRESSRRDDVPYSRDRIYENY